MLVGVPRSCNPFHASTPFLKTRVLRLFDVIGIDLGIDIVYENSVFLDFLKLCFSSFASKAPRPGTCSRDAMLSAFSDVFLMRYLYTYTCHYSMFKVDEDKYKWQLRCQTRVVPSALRSNEGSFNLQIFVFLFSSHHVDAAHENRIDILDPPSHGRRCITNHYSTTSSFLDDRLTQSPSAGTRNPLTLSFTHATNYSFVEVQCLISFEIR